jgi:hypothetical protein
VLVTGAIKSGGLDWGKHRVCEELTVNPQEINIRLRSEQFLKRLAGDYQQKSEHYSVAVNKAAVLGWVVLGWAGVV